MKQKTKKIVNLIFVIFSVVFSILLPIFSCRANNVNYNSHVYSFLRGIEKNEPSNYCIKAYFNEETEFRDVIGKIKDNQVGKIDPDFLWMGNATACVTIDENEFNIESISLEGKEAITDITIKHFATAQTYYNPVNGEILGPKLKVKYKSEKGDWLQPRYVYISESLADSLVAKYNIDEKNLLGEELKITGNGDEEYFIKIKNIYIDKNLNTPIGKYYESYFSNGIIFSDTTVETDLYRNHKPVLCFNSRSDQRNFDDMIYYLKTINASKLIIEYYSADSCWVISDFTKYFNSYQIGSNLFDKLAIGLCVLGIFCFIFGSEVIFKKKLFNTKLIFIYLIVNFLILLFISVLYVFLFNFSTLLSIFSPILSSYLSVTFFYLIFKCIYCKIKKELWKRSLTYSKWMRKNLI